ncbi:hypothetical protein BSPA14S_K0001 (plasmid) [Borreliella spielmanii A14S]|uniref:Uncharacterized protein n=1 Tax=Borreliella spielmanii A14S TaxID=498742 RepID=C0RBR1_9SPIR|nr:hypothetical protein BSPA14S_K0001 [Borreliella spielmanii A14S]
MLNGLKNVMLFSHKPTLTNTSTLQCYIILLSSREEYLFIFK